MVADKLNSTFRVSSVPRRITKYLNAVIHLTPFCARVPYAHKMACVQKYIVKCNGVFYNKSLISLLSFVYIIIRELF